MPGMKAVFVDGAQRGDLRSLAAETMSLARSLQSKLGRPHERHAVPAEFLDAYRERAPEALLDFWGEVGWCAYLRHQLWFVDPRRFHDMIVEWLPDWCVGEERPLVFARGAFGDLLVLHEGNVGHLSVHYGRYMDMECSLEVFVEVALRKKYVSNAMKGDMVSKATKRLGSISADEMYTFEPALALGGSDELKHTKKVMMLPQLSILAQLFDEIMIE